MANKEEPTVNYLGEHRFDYTATYYMMVPRGLDIFCPDCGACGEEMMKRKPCRRTILDDRDSN